MPVDNMVDVEGNPVILSLERKSVRPYRTADEYLYVMKEDLADWFNTLYAFAITVDDFFEQLDTGTLMCQHANYVHRFVHENPALRDVIDVGEVTYKADVRPGTFQSRDNISNFIHWCRRLGIPDVLLFETNDLVLRANERNVVLCLLEVARRGARYGVLAPVLVQMEEEIDAEISGEQPPPKRTRPMPYRAPVDMMSLDEMVRDLLGRCTCPQQFPMHRIAEGKYQIGDSLTVIFVRILRYHVMVRIGGGWDTLENYLDRHDPCQCQTKGHKTARRGCSSTPQKKRPNVASVSRTPSRAATSEPAVYESPTNSNINKSPRTEGPGSTPRSLKTPNKYRRLPQTPQHASGGTTSYEPNKRADRQRADSPLSQDMLAVHSKSSRSGSIHSSIPSPLHRNYGSNSDLAATSGRQSPLPMRPGSARPATRTYVLGDRRRSVDPQGATPRGHDDRSGSIDATSVRRQLIKPDADRGRRLSNNDVLLISRDNSGRHRVGCVNGNGNDATNGSGNGRRLSSTRIKFDTQHILPDKPKAVTRSDDVDAMCLSGDELSVPRRKYRPPLVKSMSLTSSEEEGTLSRSSTYDFNEYPDVAPPEDRALNEQMERLFEAYRLHEQQASNGEGSAPLSRASSTLSVQSEGYRQRQPAGHVATGKTTRVEQARYRDSSRSRVVSVAASRDSSRSRVASAAASRDSSRSRVAMGAASRDTSRSRVAMGAASRDSSRSRVASAVASRDSSRSRGTTDDAYSQYVRPAAERLARSRCRAREREPHAAQAQRNDSRDSRAGKTPQSASGKRDASVARSSRDSSVSRQSRNVSVTRQSRDSSVSRVSRGPNATQPPRDSSVSRQSRVSTPSRDSSVTRWSRASSVSRGSRDSSVSRRSRADGSNNVPRNQPRRITTLDDVNDNACRSHAHQSDQAESIMTSSDESHEPFATTGVPTTDSPLETALAKPRRDKRSYSRTRIPMPVDMKRRLADQADNGSTLKRFDSGVDINNMSPTDSSLVGEDEDGMWNQNEAMTMANQPLSCQTDGRDEEYY